MLPSGTSSKPNIRCFNPNDYPLILSWWKAAGEVAPTPDMLPLESSFIFEDAEGPLLCVTVYKTNARWMAWVDNFIGRPGAGTARREATTLLLEHISEWAASQGYKNLFCLSEKGVLKAYYQSIGFQETLSGVSTFVKEITCPQQQPSAAD